MTQIPVNLVHGELEPACSPGINCVLVQKSGKRMLPSLEIGVSTQVACGLRTEVLKIGDEGRSCGRQPPDRDKEPFDIRLQKRKDLFANLNSLRRSEGDFQLAIPSLTPRLPCHY